MNIEEACGELWKMRSGGLKDKEKWQRNGGE